MVQQVHGIGDHGKSKYFEGHGKKQKASVVVALHSQVVALHSRVRALHSQAAVHRSRAPRSLALHSRSLALHSQVAVHPSRAHRSRALHSQAAVHPSRVAHPLAQISLVLHIREDGRSKYFKEHGKKPKALVAPQAHRSRAVVLRSQAQVLAHQAQALLVAV